MGSEPEDPPTLTHAQWRPQSDPALERMAEYDWGRISWQQGRTLGRGAFGTVFQGMTPQGDFFAVKQTELSGEGGNEDQRQIQAVEIMKVRCLD